MQIRVLLFAQAREFAGVSECPLALPAGGTVHEALGALVAAHPALAPLRAHLAVAVNGALARPGDAVPDGAELAVLPPVSGG